MTMGSALAVGALSFSLLATAGQAGAAEPRLMVFYVEAFPARAAATGRLLEAQAHDDRTAGAAAAEVLKETGRAGRMALVEQWPDLPQAEAARRAKALGARLEPGLQAPVDDRPNDPIVALDLKPAPAGAFHVLMHIDVIPDGAAAARQALAEQKAAVMAAPGSLAFQAASQTGRPNHFAVHEAWTSRASYEAYAASPAGRALRRRLDPFKGAPFDDRFYGY